MDNNISTSTDGNLIEPIRREKYEALKMLINPQYIKAVHMTRDFYLQVMASGEVQIGSPKESILSLFGYPVIVHDEKCDRQWWIEYDEHISEISGWRMINKNWIDRDKWFIAPHTST